MKVCKFGGSSLANAEQIRKVCDIVISDPDRRIVVVSAPGKRSRQDTKVTDLLIALANARISGYDGQTELDAVLRRFAEIAEELELGPVILATIEQDLRDRIAADPSSSLQFMDSLKAAGEDNCARLVADYLQSIGQKARYFDPKTAGLILSDEFGNAQVLDESYQHLARLKEYPGTLYSQAFLVYTRSGKVANLFPRRFPTSPPRSWPPPSEPNL
jgi:aspartate kinase